MKRTRPTRQSTSVWLVGNVVSDSIFPVQSKLPTLREVYSYFLRLHLHEKKSIRDSARNCIQELIPFWERAGIPTKDVRNATDRLVDKYNEYLSMRKDRSRYLYYVEKNEPPKTPAAVLYKEKVDKFKRELDCLFDIGHQNAMTMIEIEEDRLFYKSMREDRKGYMSGLDKQFVKKHQAAIERRDAEEARRRRSDEECSRLLSKTPTPEPPVLDVNDVPTGLDTSTGDDDDGKSESCFSLIIFNLRGIVSHYF